MDFFGKNFLHHTKETPQLPCDVEDYRRWLGIIVKLLVLVLNQIYFVEFMVFLRLNAKFCSISNNFADNVSFCIKYQ